MAETTITRRSLFKWLAAAAAAAVLPWFPKPAWRPRRPWEVRYWTADEDVWAPYWPPGSNFLADKPTMTKLTRNSLGEYIFIPPMKPHNRKIVWLINPTKGRTVPAAAIGSTWKKVGTCT